MEIPNDAISNQVVPTPDFLECLIILKPLDLINMIKCLLEDNTELEKQTTEYIVEVKEFCNESLELSNLLVDKEKVLKKGLGHKELRGMQRKANSRYRGNRCFSRC